MELRRPLFFLAMAFIALAVVVEATATVAVGGAGVSEAAFEAALGEELADVDVEPVGELSEPPGRAIPGLALLDAVALYTVALVGAALIVPGRIQGRVQGAVTIVASIVVIVVALWLLLLSFVELVVMITLLGSLFGVPVYLAAWGFFPRGDAAALLALAMALKVGFAALLVFAHPRFLQNRGLVALVVTSLVLTVVVSFLHGLPPGVLVSVTDRVGAIVAAVVAIVWGIVLLVGSIPAVVKALRVDRAATR